MTDIERTFIEVGVKALEWQDHRGDGSMQAKTPYGELLWATPNGWGNRNYPELFKGDGLEDNVAAAEENYRDTIRSCLTITMKMNNKQPTAWVFELAQAFNSETGKYSDWGEPRLSFVKPCVPEGSIRNLRPLAYGVVKADTQAEPVAWMHTLHMELEQKSIRVTRSPNDPFGEQGRDYSSTYHCTSEPLYAALATKPDHD